MNTRISDIFDEYDGGVPPIGTASPVDAQRVIMLTSQKIRGGRPKRPARRILRAAIIAAAAAVLLTAAAFAKMPQLVSGPNAAVAAANAELDVLRDAGVITADFTLSGTDCDVSLQNDGHLFSIFSRKFDPFYSISFSSGRYSGDIGINTVSGKITQFLINARADSSDKPVDIGSGFMGYVNFEDIFDTSMHMGAFCRKLCDYWGYDDYDIVSACGDHGSPQYAADGSSLLADHGSGQIKLTTVTFSGDQAGQEQYVEVSCFANGACLAAGFAHSLG